MSALFIPVAHNPLHKANFNAASSHEPLPIPSFESPSPPPQYIEKHKTEVPGLQRKSNLKSQSSHASGYTKSLAASVRWSSPIADVRIIPLSDPLIKLHNPEGLDPSMNSLSLAPQVSAVESWPYPSQAFIDSHLTNGPQLIHSAQALSTSGSQLAIHSQLANSHPSFLTAQSTRDPKLFVDLSLNDQQLSPTNSIFSLDNNTSETLDFGVAPLSLSRPPQEIQKPCFSQAKYIQILEPSLPTFMDSSFLLESSNSSQSALATLANTRHIAAEICSGLIGEKHSFHTSSSKSSKQDVFRRPSLLFKHPLQSKPKLFLQNHSLETVLGDNMSSIVQESQVGSPRTWKVFKSTKHNHLDQMHRLKKRKHQSASPDQNIRRSKSIRLDENGSSMILLRRGRTEITLPQPEIWSSEEDSSNAPPDTDSDSSVNGDDDMRIPEEDNSEDYEIGASWESRRKFDAQDTSHRRNQGRKRFQQRISKPTINIFKLTNWSNDLARFMYLQEKGKFDVNTAAQLHHRLEEIEKWKDDTFITPELLRTTKLAQHIKAFRHSPYEKPTKEIANVIYKCWRELCRESTS